jgi:hypothetical protein
LSPCDPRGQPSARSGFAFALSFQLFSLAES